MQTYHAMLRHVLENGTVRSDRTGVGTVGAFGYQVRFNLEDGFPLLTTKRVHTRSVFGELLWMLQGRTDNNWLRDRKITIWDEWADENGELGPVYGQQWRGVPKREGVWIDQFETALHTLRNDPFSRRHIINAWNPAQLGQMALPPCHAFVQFHVEETERGQRLSTHLYQRSADAFLGVPFNIAGYAALTHVVSHMVPGTYPGDLVTSYGDLHIYRNHLEQVDLQLSRKPKQLPSFSFNPDPERVILGASNSVWMEEGQVCRSTPKPLLGDPTNGFRIEDFQVTGYDPHPGIKAPVAV